MNFNKKLATAVSGAVLLMAGQFALADSTTDIVDALVSKGVLTEEEGKLISKGHAGEKKAQDKSIKGKLKISDALDSATLYGDIRVRAEARSGSGPTTAGGPDVDAKIDRARYKMTFGVKTEAGNWYSDLAFAMGKAGRSDNATLGHQRDGAMNGKETLYIKRAMLGYKATDWLTLEAGRMENPLYTTPMVWDADLTVEGLSEKVKFKLNDQAELFGVAGQWAYKGERYFIDGVQTIASPTNELLAFQGGIKYAFSDRTSAKAALTYSTITSNNNIIDFKPGVVSKMLVGNAGVNNLDTIEIPAEINYMASSNIGVRVFGDYVYNASGSDRFDRAVLASGTDAAAIQAAGNDDTAWMLGIAIGSAKDLKAFEGNKMAKGDWSARLWYQEVGVYALDQNAVDSDIFDSRVNTKGIAFKAKYNVEDNVILDFALAHATRKNDALATAGAAGDLSPSALSSTFLNWKDFDLVQVDVTYKF